MHRFCPWFFFLLLAICTLPAQAQPQRMESDGSLALERIAGPITIDGVVDEAQEAQAEELAAGAVAAEQLRRPMPA
jgi:hypothetical protein